MKSIKPALISKSESVSENTIILLSQFLENCDTGAKLLILKEHLTPTLMLSQFHFDIFISGASIESAQIFAAVFGFFTIYRLPRRIEGGVSFFIIMICSIVLIFIWDQN